MQHLQRRKNDHFLFGFLTSLGASTFGFAMVYVFKFMNSNISLGQYINTLITEPSFRSSIISLALLANIPLLYFIQQRKLYKSFTGLAVAVIVLGIFIIINKLNIL